MTADKSQPLKFLVFLGSVRQSTPPRPARLGERVAHCCVRSLGEYSHNVTLIDPLTLNLRSSDSDGVFKPHFAYAERRAPDDLDRLAKVIKAADAFVMVSPEYNHSMSPALADLLNHFGSSLFSYKPSAIVTYSAGQWGGARAAVNMRTYLSELGCLPVSAMIHIPKAQDVLDAQGNYSDGQKSESWNTYLDRTFAQLGWWAEATRSHRRTLDPEQILPAFKDNPGQRNAGR